MDGADFSKWDVRAAKQMHIKPKAQYMTYGDRQRFKFFEDMVCCRHTRAHCERRFADLNGIYPRRCSLRDTHPLPTRQEFRGLAGVDEKLRDHATTLFCPNEIPIT